MRSARHLVFIFFMVLMGVVANSPAQAPAQMQTPAPAQGLVGAQSGFTTPMRPINTLSNRAPLRVGVMEFPPYAFRSGVGQWSGLGVTLFEHIADLSQLKYVYIEFASPHELGVALHEGTIDFAAIGVDPTPEMELAFNFSNAFNQSGTSIAIRKNYTVSFADIALQLWHSNVSRFVGMILLALILFGAVVGLIERRKNMEQFGGSKLSTIGHGLWWSCATISTVGYGDCVPTTKRGRIFGGLWMLISFALMTVLAGLISSVLTVSRFNSQIHSLADLSGVNCGAVNESAAMAAAQNFNLKMKGFDLLTEALKALASNEIGAVLGDASRMRWILNDSQFDSLAMLPTSVATVYAAFPLSDKLDADTVNVINFHLIQITNSSEWNKVRQLYLGN